MGHGSPGFSLRHRFPPRRDRSFPLESKLDSDALWSRSLTPGARRVPTRIGRRKEAESTAELNRLSEQSSALARYETNETPRPCAPSCRSLEAPRVPGRDGATRGETNRFSARHRRAPESRAGSGCERTLGLAALPSARRINCAHSLDSIVATEGRLGPVSKVTRVSARHSFRDERQASERSKPVAETE
jgi:hypothetical protein